MDKLRIGIIVGASCIGLASAVLVIRGFITLSKIDKSINTLE